MGTKPLKIFVDGHVFDKEYQGSQTFLKCLYKQLMMDYPLLEIYFGVQNVTKFKIEFPDFPTDRILIYKKRRFGLLRFIFDIPFLLKKYQFDFAHFQYISPKQIHGCKYIVTLHDTLFNDFKNEFGFIYRMSRNLLFGRSIKNAAIKTTVSEYSRQQIHKHYHIAIQQLHVIPNGIDLPKIKTLKEDAINIIDKKFGVKNFILYVSRVEPRKNHILLLKTYLKLKLYQQNIALVFIGKESIPVQELNLLIKNLDHEQRNLFYWIEQVEQAELNNFYLASRLFVYPSKAEGFGIPPLEAARSQRPVLCSNATAMRDFNFFEPHTFNPQDEEEFEQKLTSILASPPRNDFLNKIAQQVQEKYNWQHSGNLFYNLLTTNQ